MNGIDLSGSIIVLTHSRTGSSLLMQTLRLLGADVVGDFEHPDLDQQLNPKGFYENRAILRNGLHAKVLLTEPAMLRDRAVKIALRMLVIRKSEDEWAALARPNTTLLLPIRSPSEVLQSRQALLQSSEAPMRRLQFQASWRDNLLDFGFLANRVLAGGFAQPPVCIDYGEAIEDPARYVRHVAAAAGLSCTPSATAEAIANIDRGLYHVRATDAEVRRSAQGALPLEKIYELLRADDALKWVRLRECLPPWVFNNEAVS